tara:strand:+ start:44 stop:283 length:240 start_codon:yes stop_codon:yes gene_type:complete
MKVLKQTQNDWLIRKVYLIGESKTSWSHKIKIEQTATNNGNTILSTKKYQANLSYDLDGELRINKALKPYFQTTEFIKS